MSDEPGKLDLEQKAKDYPLIPLNYLEPGTTLKGVENDDERQARLAEAFHKRWRTTITELGFKPIFIGFLCWLIIQASSVWIDPEVPLPIKSNAQSLITLVLGIISGYFAGRVDRGGKS